MQTGSPLDQVILIDEHDNEIGVMDKVEAHRGEGKLHRAVSVYLFRRTSSGCELLMQQRSAKKIVGAGQWANTICGNVRPGETRHECALRRLREEIGVTAATITPIYTFTYQVKCNDQFSEFEIDGVFVGWYDGEVDLNPDEVHRIEWVDWAELQHKRSENKMESKELAPWFVWMLNDPQLVATVTTFTHEQ